MSVIHTGVANLASILSALERVGCLPRVTSDPGDVEAARLAVLPGVGAFGPAMSVLRERGLDSAVTSRVQDGRPLLAICLGLHLLFESSDESLGVAGLGLIPGRITRFDPRSDRSLRVPQMGWNTIAADPACAVLRSGSMYFANSYKADHAPTGWNCAIADHAGPFVAGMERGPVLACQFHPELSGPAGLALLSRWLERCGVLASARVRAATAQGTRAGASRC